jgi:hypothetical protein
LATPAILRWSRRFRLERPHLVTHLLAHLGLLAVLVPAIKLLYDLIVKPSSSAFIDFTFARLLRSVEMTHALIYYRRYQNSLTSSSQLQTQLVQAQLQALKMQLHPHFLFNTLHSITALVHEATAWDAAPSRGGSIFPPNAATLCGCSWSPTTARASLKIPAVPFSTLWGWGSRAEGSNRSTASSSLWWSATFLKAAWKRASPCRSGNTLYRRGVKHMPNFKILIVDDERLSRRRARRLLSLEPDCEVLGECTNGREALAAMQQSRPDMVFSMCRCRRWMGSMAEKMQTRPACCPRSARISFTRSSFRKFRLRMNSICMPAFAANCSAFSRIPVPERLREFRIVENPDISHVQKRGHSSRKTDPRQGAEDQHPVPAAQYTGNLRGVTFRQ